MLKSKKPKNYEPISFSETFTSAQIKRAREQDAIDQRQKVKAKEQAAKAAKRQPRI
jgi:hypothetical protein